jgi:hypothetical protein
MPNERQWLVVKDDQGRWYFHHGIHAPKLVTEAPVDYLESLIKNDMGHISLEARIYIDKIAKSARTRAANAGT